LKAAWRIVCKHPEWLFMNLILSQPKSYTKWNNSGIWNNIIQRSW
jgi:hypothetical protein